MSGLSIEMRGNRLLLLNHRGGYQELDITPLYFFFKEFFITNWKKDYAKIQKNTSKQK